VTLFRRVALVTVAILAIAACGSAASPAQPLSGLVLSPPPQVGGVSLPDASVPGKVFTFKAQPGHLLVAYFGYTSCPDVCPTTLNELKHALAKLGTNAARVDVAMTTIDPARDTGAALTGYVQGFIPGAHALRTGDDTALRAAADAFGAGYTVTTNAKGEEEVSHSGQMYVVDSNGTVVLEWLFGIKAAAIATDLSILMRTA
jgi:protein SCO1/2